MDSTIPLNKFEKHNLILKLLSEGKIYREICKLAHVSPRDIKPIAKEYERKKRLETKKEATKQKPKLKKLSFSRIFKLFSEGKNQTDCVIELDAHPDKIEKLWHLYLKAERIEECYDFFQDCQYDIPTLTLINNFLKMNDLNGHDILDILRKAKTITNLRLIITNLQNEITRLQQIRRNNMRIPPIVPFPKYFKW